MWYCIMWQSNFVWLNSDQIGSGIDIQTVNSLFLNISDWELIASLNRALLIDVDTHLYLKHLMTAHVPHAIDSLEMYVN